MEDKHIITPELVEGLSNMIKSEDHGDINLAMVILDNRDKENVESEECFKQMMALIVKDDVLFPSQPMYVIKINGRILTVKDRSVFNSEAEARKWLSLHLSNKIGVETNNKYKISRYTNLSPYLKAIRHIFKSGIKMRDFLVRNDLVEIVEIK